MTPLQLAIVMALHQEPNYIFSAGENSAARAMERRGVQVK